MEHETVALLRMAERMLAVALAGLSIYCGYRLFRDVRYEATGEGTFKLPGGASVIVSKIGPGVFFALFGAMILAISFFKGVSWGPNVNVAGGGVAGATGDAVSRSNGTGFSGITPLISADSSASVCATIDREPLGRHFDVLNRVIPGALQPNLDVTTRNDIDVTRREIKLALMRASWNTPEWGDYAGFRDWVRNGEPEPVPRPIRKAVAFYRGS